MPLIGALEGVLDRSTAARAPDELTALQTELEVRGAELANALSVERRYVDALDPSRIALDPRLLAFEFLSTFVLKQSQVSCALRKGQWVANSPFVSRPAV